MLWETWGTWPDATVDFGQELNIAWKVWQGQPLYSQVAHYHGPLSPYLNALWFRLFGPSIRTLELCNLAILAALIGLLYHMFGRVGSRAVSTVACVIFVLLFAFARFAACGNYNYVCPYAHDMTHGLLLTMGSLAAMWGFRRRRRTALVVSGLALGGAFLTRSEVFVAALGGTGTALLLFLIAYGGTVRKTLASLGVFCASSALPPVAALLALSRVMPVRQAAEGLLVSYRTAANPELRHLKFFLDGAGLSDVSGNLRALFLWCGGYLAVLAPLALLALAVRKRFRHRWVAVLAAFIVTGGILLASWQGIDWAFVALPLPVVLAVGAIVLLLSFLRHRGDTDGRERVIRQLSLVILSLGLLPKMILNARIYHYGFALAMPGTLLLVTLLLGWIPKAVSNAGGTGAVFAAGAVALLLACVAIYLAIQRDCLRGVKFRIAAGTPNEFLADSRGPFVSAILKELRARSSPGETLAVLPQGPMVNFLSARANPTPYSNLMPTEMILFGEENVLASFRSHPPDWIVLAHEDTSEFGYRFFGRDYGQRLFDWVLRSYDPVVLLGQVPLRDSGYGMLLMRRKPTVAPP